MAGHEGSLPPAPAGPRSPRPLERARVRAQVAVDSLAVEHARLRAVT